MALAAGIISLAFGSLTLAFVRGGLLLLVMGLAVIASTIVAVFAGKRLLKEGKKRQANIAMITGEIGFILMVIANGIAMLSSRV